MNQEEMDHLIPEEQQQLVLERICKYEANPELLVSEEDARKIINEM